MTLLWIFVIILFAAAILQMIMIWRLMDHIDILREDRDDAFENIDALSESQHHLIEATQEMSDEISALEDVVYDCQCEYCEAEAEQMSEEEQEFDDFGRAKEKKEVH